MHVKVIFYQYLSVDASDACYHNVCCFCMLQPCQENLFVTLVKEFRSVFPQVIMEILGENQEVVEADDLAAVLRKDAGLLCYLLKFHILTHRQ